MSISNRQIHALLVASRETHDEELDCEQFLESMAALAEARAEGRPLPASFEKVLAHERLCANCSEECRAVQSALGDVS